MEMGSWKETENFSESNRPYVVLSVNCDGFEKELKLSDLHYYSSLPRLAVIYNSLCGSQL